MDQEIAPQVNGQRINALTRKKERPPAVRPVTVDEALALVSANQATQLLLQASTSPGKLLKVIKQALGSAEAEIEFVERVRIRED